MVVNMLNRKFARHPSLPPFSAGLREHWSVPNNCGPARGCKGRALKYGVFQTECIENPAFVLPDPDDNSGNKNWVVRFLEEWWSLD